MFGRASEARATLNETAELEENRLKDLNYILDIVANPDLAKSRLTVKVNEDGTFTASSDKYSDFVLMYEDKDKPVTVSAKYSMSLSLQDSIDINFFVKNVDENANLSDFRVVYTFGDTTTEATLTNYESNRFTVAKCAAKEIGDIVVVNVYYQNELIKTVNYSARTYCENKLSAQNTSEGLKALCRATLDYGAYAQKSFGYKIDDLVNANYSAGTVLTTVIPDTYYAQSSTGSCSGVTKTTVSLSLESKTELYFYFKPASGVTLEHLTVILNGYDKKGEVTLADSGAYCLKIQNISATQLADVQTISITYNGETKTVTYSPLTWAYNKQNNNNEDTANVAKALYNYYIAAQYLN